MLEISLGSAGRPLKTLVALGAHCDDIEIGCGGTLLRLAEQHPRLRVHWVVMSSSSVREAEARRSADRFLRGVRDKEVVVQNFRNGFFPYEGARIKEFFEQLKTRVAPDMILTHARHDLHQDHRLLAELTWNTFRDHLILEYEIPKYDGDLGAPNFFVPLSKEIYRNKIETIMECFPSQQDKQWFTAETFGALMRLRGIEANSPSGYAEAFYCRKVVI